MLKPNQLRRALAYEALFPNHRDKRPPFEVVADADHQCDCGAHPPGSYCDTTCTAGVATGGALPDPKLCPRCCQYHGPVCPAGVLVDYSFRCYSCSKEWEATTTTTDCPACGTTNNHCAANPRGVPEGGKS